MTDTLLLYYEWKEMSAKSGKVAKRSMLSRRVKKRCVGQESAAPVGIDKHMASAFDELGSGDSYCRTKLQLTLLDIT